MERREGPVVLPYHQLVFAKYLLELAPEIESLRSRAFSPIIQRSLGLLPYPCVLEGGVAANVFERILHNLEDELSRRISKHSFYYWLHLYRRLAPENAFKDALIGTVFLYRDTLELAFLKYGHSDVAAEFVSGENPELILGGEFKRLLEERGLPLTADPKEFYVGPFSIEAFKELLAVEALAHTSYLVTGALRCIYKGGRVTVEGSTHYSIELDPCTEKLIESFDKRNEEFGEITTPIGVPFGGFRAPMSGSASPKIILVPVLNIQRHSFDQLGLNMLTGTRLLGPSGGAPNFAWVPLDLRIFERRHTFANEAFQAKWRFSLNDLSRFMAVLFREFFEVFSRASLGAKLNLLQRAYICGPRDSFFQAWRYVGCSLGWPDLAPKLDTIFASLCYSEEDRAAINLWTRGPRKVFSQMAGDRVLVDFTAITHVLRDAVRNLTFEQAAKGPVFEDMAAGQIRRMRGTRVWKRRAILKAQDGSEREIDLGLVCCGVLFVCECNVTSVSVAFGQGRTEALEFRRGKLEQKLRQADSLARWLARNRIGVNFKIPKAIHSIVPLVLSPFCEWIWTQDASLWLSEKVPRVCTPLELQSVLESEDDLASISSRGYAQRL